MDVLSHYYEHISIVPIVLIIYIKTIAKVLKERLIIFEKLLF